MCGCIMLCTLHIYEFMLPCCCCCCCCTSGTPFAWESHHHQYHGAGEPGFMRLIKNVHVTRARALLRINPCIVYGKGVSNIHVNFVRFAIFIYELRATLLECKFPGRVTNHFPLRIITVIPIPNVFTQATVIKNWNIIEIYIYCVKIVHYSSTQKSYSIEFNKKYCTTCAFMISAH